MLAGSKEATVVTLLDEVIDGGAAATASTHSARDRAHRSAPDGAAGVRSVWVRTLVAYTLSPEEAEERWYRY